MTFKPLKYFKNNCKNRINKNLIKILYNKKKMPFKVLWKTFIIQF